MDYSIDSVGDIAKQVAALMQSAIEKQKETHQPINIRDIETTMRKMLRQVGAEALEKVLSSSLEPPVPTLACHCGGKLKYQRRRSAKVISVFGRVTYKRDYYAGCQCGKGYAPVDACYGLQPGAVTAGLAALVGLAGVEFSFEHSQEWLQTFLLFEVSENTVRAETETLGALALADDLAQSQSSQNETYLQKRLRDEVTVPPRLYGSIDAAKVRIEPRKQAEKQEDNEAWRDLKVGCWYETEGVSPKRCTPRERTKQEREAVVYRAKNIRYYCDIAEASEFGKLMWGQGCREQADLARELIFVCDGATWIWKLVEQYYPHAVQIVDWYHAEERLERVAQDAFPNRAMRDVWFKESQSSLWEGQVAEVIQRCDRLAPKCAEAQHAVTYFTHNESRMRYDKFRAAGYLIGSGTVESGCKQIVTERLKRSGAQWLVAGAVKTAKARAVWLSGRWEALCARRDALPLAI